MDFVKLWKKSQVTLINVIKIRIKLTLYSILTWLVLVRSAGLRGLFKNFSTAFEYPFSTAK